MNVACPTLRLNQCRLFRLVSVCVVESQSHYPAPADPVVLSAVSSMLISHNRVLEDCSSVTLDVYPVYEMSPDTTDYLPASAPVTPPAYEVSLPPPALESLPPGAPLSLSGVVACDITLLDRSVYLSHLAISLFPLPDGMLLVPVMASDQPFTSTERPSRREQCARVAPPSRDLSREGPFDAYVAPLDTGDLLLFGILRVAGLPLSYDVERHAQISPMWIRCMTYSYTTPGSLSSLGFLSRLACWTGPQVIGSRLWTGRTLLWRLANSSMMPASWPRICRSLVSLWRRSTACHLRFYVWLSGRRSSHRKRWIFLLVYPAPLTTCRLWTYGSLRVARALPHHCRSHSEIAVWTVLTVFLPSLGRIGHGHYCRDGLCLLDYVLPSWLWPESGYVDIAILLSCSLTTYF